jgi:hypothetical protein
VRAQRVLSPPLRSRGRRPISPQASLDAAMKGIAMPALAGGVQAATLR